VSTAVLTPHARRSERPHQLSNDPFSAAVFDNNLTTTPVDVRGDSGTQRTIRRIQYAVRLHSSVGRAADS
jgi:hypothetical protein